jgi:membrane associated rhomboid family serine protease
MLGVAAFFLGRRLQIQRVPLAPITFHADHLVIPRHILARRSSRVSYQEIHSVHLGGDAPHAQFLMEAGRSIFRLEQLAFVDPQGPEKLYALLRRRILDLGDGQARLDAMRQREHIATLAMRTRPWVTHIVLGTLWVFWLNQMLGGGLDPFALIGWGAVWAPLVREGEYFRLLSCSFLHANHLHILLNSLALYSLGSLMERFLGWERYAVVYLASGLGAGIASVTLGHSASVGASGAIFGLLGSLAVVNLRYRRRLPLGLRQPLGWWVFIVGVNAMLPLLVPEIDLPGHIGGLLVGALVTVRVLLPGESIQPAAPADNWLKVIALSLIGTFAVGLATSVWYARNYDDARRLDVMRRLVRADDFGQHNAAYWLNAIAFAVAIHPGASADDLAQAEAKARAAVDQRPSDPSVLDTLATVHYRQGRLADAVKEQRRAFEDLNARYMASIPQLARAQEPVFATQLMRFLRAHDAPLPSGIEAEVVLVREAPPRIQVRLRGERPDVYVYIAVMRGPLALGLVRLAVPASASGTQEYAPPGDLALTNRTQAQLLLVAPAKVESLAWESWTSDAEVLAYP